MAILRKWRRRCRFGALVAGLLLPGTGAQAAPEGAVQDKGAVFEAIRAADMKLAAIGWSLAVGNAALCDTFEPGMGFQLHTLDQFDGADRAAAAAHFDFETPVAIEGLVPGSPAEQAGLRADDSLVRVGTVEIAALPGRPGTTQRLVAAQLAIAALPAEAAIDVAVLREGRPVRATIRPVRSCKSRFELKLTNSFSASADGTMVQISSRFLETYPAEQVAAVVAHEFSHNILRHRVRLEARGVSFGMLSGFGGNVKYFRQTEVQADLLSLYLLNNAGYPARAAPQFWRRFGPRGGGGILASRSHPHWRDRIATMEAEIARLETMSARPIVPALIADRGRPLNGDWQSLLIRHR